MRLRACKPASEREVDEGTSSNLLRHCNEPGDHVRSGEGGGTSMDQERAEQNLEIIRTLMERANRYEYLSARAGLQVGVIAVAGSLSFFWLDPGGPFTFGAVWFAVFWLSVGVMVREQVREVQSAGVPLWTRPAREIVRALVPAMTMSALLSLHAFAHGRHLDLPGVWMLCYGVGALATSTYAPPVVFQMGVAFMLSGALTLWLGPAWATAMMGLVFGGGHLALGIGLLATRRRPLRQVKPAAI